MSDVNAQIKIVGRCDAPSTGSTQSTTSTNNHPQRMRWQASMQGKGFDLGNQMQGQITLYN